MDETVTELLEKILEGLAAGGLEGLTAAGFYICFFGSGRGAVLAGTGIGAFSFGAFLKPEMQPCFLIFSALWLMAAAAVRHTRQCQELFLAGGLWVLLGSLAGLWPGRLPLQTISALVLLLMAAVFLLDRAGLYPLWMGTLVCLWLMAGFFYGIDYGAVWKDQVMKTAGYLVLGGVLIFQQVFCIRQELRRKAWEEAGEQNNKEIGERNDKEVGERNDEETGEQTRAEIGKETGMETGKAGKRPMNSGILWGKIRPAAKRETGNSGDGTRDWQKDAAREYDRLRIFEHDFRHHLDMLGALYEEGNPAEARAYLEDLKQARISGRGQKYGGERELSYLMMAKKEACRRAGISFSSQILGSPRGITQMDMTALLLNLLDNAVRACEKAPEPRSIEIMLLARGDFWQIELVNTGVYEETGEGKRSGKQETGEDREEQAFRLRKPAPAHGIGLISVRQIVEKYQGIFEIRQEQNTVVQKLILIGKLP